MKRNKGITLIALIITIIVLLILAGISIAMLTGDNGILKKTTTAKEETTKGAAEEKVKIAVSGSYNTNGRIDKDELNENLQNIEGIDKNTLPVEDLPTTVKVDGYNIEIEGKMELGKLKPGVIVTKENREYEKNGTAIIPVGFAIVPNLDDVSEGLVISDVANDTENQGNQFVWVPVPEIKNFKVIAGYENGNLQNITNFSQSEPYIDGYSTEEQEYNEMKESVERNKGFYIGRYEAGIENDKVVVKKNKKVHAGSVDWGGNMKATNGVAVKLSKEFANDKSYISVTSTLCYAVQWDATMQFFDSNYINGTCSDTSYVKNSTERGNYNATEAVNTGSNENYQEKHIYDMAGNVYEWTMEGSNRDGGCRFFRGGSFIHNAVNAPASHRASDYPYGVADYIGYRITLYIK